MKYTERVENGVPTWLKNLDRAHTLSGGRLVETTPQVNRKTAESAMLLSQGARRAIEMMREARNGSVEPVAPVTAETDHARRA